MGYYTTYTLEVETANDGLDGLEVIQKFREFSESANYCLNEEGYPEETGKWYNSVEDLQKFSLLYPSCLFTLSGVGEDNEDMWIAYVKNGKSHRCDAIITFPPPDLKKLI